MVWTVKLYEMGKKWSFIKIKKDSMERAILIEALIHVVRIVYQTLWCGLRYYYVNANYMFKLSVLFFVSHR